jgi:predicted component of type VI protein secretion system
MSYEVLKLEDFSPASLDKAVQELLMAVRQEADALSGENDWKNFRDCWMARKNGILTQVNDL